MKAIPLRPLNVINFIKHHIIHRFSVLKRIIHNNGPQFVSQSFFQFCDKYRIQNVASIANNPAANGLAEGFNKTIIKLLKKVCFFKQIKLEWEAQRISLSLPNSSPNPTGNTPFFLVYGCEEVIALEIQILSLRVVLATKMIDRDTDRLHLQELEVLDKMRL